MNPLSLWQRLRRTQLLNVLREQIWTLEQLCVLRKHEHELLALRCEALAAQLEASRLQHAKALQRIDSLEVALDHADAELLQSKRMRRKERQAARMWITRTVQARIICN